MIRIGFAITLLILTGCSVAPPRQSDNLCATFTEKEEWYESAEHSYAKWGVPIHVQMAIMHQESRFVADAEPARPWLLGVIPWFRPSSAYGYAQAKDETWEHYLNQTGNSGADRDDFADAADFIGWYCSVSHRQLGIAMTDAKNLYLAYHEGHGGYKRKSHLSKSWLLRVAEKVAHRATLFQNQLNNCIRN
ncbi:MAG: hypothetical protein WC782_09025 [Methylococcaceae bacterium]|jgi:hypothetical protein